MYGDELQKAINTINNYLQQGNTIGLWDYNKPTEKTLVLDSKSRLDFAIWRFNDWDDE